ncbi:hypothetical protein EDM00_08710 [Ornithobacterium rhinotracheale]|uniref:GEVED domain-containing protein n=1 Tax=Ornithobacterium rhinotracheale TaxID=28251 RepID=UPI00129C9D43|nr:GEVED domain-containing protein [Ornithobacterium rhinotracheale]MRI64067.1 hypothetical protein [Ornithobacterium rhinotracheale]
MRFIYFLLFTILVSFNGKAQDRWCPSDVIYRNQLEYNPVFREKQNILNQKWEKAQREMLQKSRRKKRDLISDYRKWYTFNADLNFTLPIVFHIIYKEEITPKLKSENEQRIIDLLRYTNDLYAGIAPNIKGPSNGGAYAPIQFALAKSTPDNKSTTGIIHIDGRNIPEYVNHGLLYVPQRGIPLPPAVGENYLKAKSKFPEDFAINVYMVHTISKKENNKIENINFAAYAYPNGFIYLKKKYAIAGNTTFAHELGHVLGLSHVFEGSSGKGICPKNNDCFKDNDQICDTEPLWEFIAYKNEKFNGINPCTQKPFEGGQLNIMHYGFNDEDRFTPGQVFKMLEDIKNMPQKQKLLKSNALRQPIDIADTKCFPKKTNEFNGLEVGIKSMTFGNLQYQNYDTNATYFDHTKEYQLNQTRFFAGKSYDFTFTPKNGSHKFFVFIDFNDDGVFDKNTEKVIENQKILFRPKTFSVKIPNTSVKNKPIRMRVVTDLSKANLKGNAHCAEHVYGQTEDFAITIISNPYEKIENESSKSEKIGINNNSPETTLDIVSKDNGVLFPRMNNQQMWNIKNPPVGTLVYNLNEHCLALNYGKDFPRWRCLATQVIDSFANSSQENNTIANPENIANEGKVGINTEEPQGVLEVKSNFFGVQFPRLSQDEIKKIKSPEEGLVVYNTTNRCLSINIGNSENPIWRCIRNKK